MITRQFNNSTIEIKEDGYFNLTSMFKPFGKYPKDYLKTDSAKAFIAALEADGTNILSGTELVQVIKGVNEEGYFNATLLVELFNKRTTDYLRLDSTKTLVKNLEISDPSKPVVKKYRGGQGTWLRNDMLSSLETWLNKVPKPSSQWKEDIFFQWLTQRIEEKQLALTLNFQYPVLSYRIDCYIPELNLCIEFDARPPRQQAIITHLKCQFFSINEAHIGRDFTRLTSLLETQAKRVTRFINIFD